MLRFAPDEHHQVCVRGNAGLVGCNPLESAPKEMKAIVAALESPRGVAKITAVTVAVEVGSFRRFERASQLMS